MQPVSICATDKWRSRREGASVLLRVLCCALRAVISESASTSAPGTSFHGQAHELLQLRAPPLLAAHDASRYARPLHCRLAHIHLYIAMASVDGEAAEREEVSTTHGPFAVLCWLLLTIAAL